MAAATAGVLALILVPAPSDTDEAQSQLRAVQLMAFAPSSTALSAAILKEFVRQQGQTVLPVNPVVVAAKRTAEIVTNPVSQVQAVRPTAPATRLIDAPARSVVGPAIESQQATVAAAASPGVITNPILRSIIAAGLFFVVIPAFWVVVIVTSAINVVLDALGLPLLPNVPDPPFGPTQPQSATTAAVVETNLVSDDPVGPQTNTAASLSGSVDKDVALSDPVVPQVDQTAPSSAGGEIDAPSSETMKRSPRFTPKRRLRDSSSLAPTSAQKRVESAADDASNEGQQAIGGGGQKLRKPKADNADGARTKGQSSKQGLSSSAATHRRSNT
jgi:hypothetical protein